MTETYKQTVPCSELMKDDRFKIGGVMYIVTEDAQMSYSSWRVHFKPVKNRRSGNAHEYHSMTLPGGTGITIYNKK